MHSPQVSFGAFLAVAASMVILAAPPARAVVLGIDPASNVVQVDSNTSGVNNSLPLVDSAGNVTISASGNASFGSLPGEVYNSMVISYRDASDRRQYAAAPMNAAGVVISGNHYDYALLTDLTGNIPGNTGTTLVSELNSTNSPIGGGTIFAGSISPAQTGVAEVSPSNTAFFNTSPPTPGLWNVSVSGSAFYAPGKEYGSVVVQYRDATNGITYDSLAIGSNKNYLGFNFRVFITDTVGQAGDNSGGLSVNITPVPEPGAAIALCALAAAARARRRFRR